MLCTLAGLPAGISTVSAAPGTQTPTLDEIRRAAAQPASLDVELTRWLDAYPESAAGWPADDLTVLVAHLVGADMGRHPQAPAVAVDHARRHADERPFRLDRSAKAFSLASRLLLAAGRNDTADEMVREALALCAQGRDAHGTFADIAEATPCAFLVRDHAILGMRAGRTETLAEELRVAIDWLGPYPRSDAWIPLLNTAADLACWHGEVDECFDHYRRATDFARDRLGEKHETTAYGYLGQGWAAALAHRWGAARASFDQAERIWARQLGPAHPRLADVLVEYGELLRQSGDAADAVRVLQRAVGLRTSRMGPHAFDLPRALDALGLSYLDLGAFDQAEQALTRSAEIRRRHLDDDNVEHARSWSALALLAEARGASGEAEGLLARSLARRSARLGADHAATAETSLRLAALLVDDRPARAKELTVQARSALTRAYGGEHPAVGRAWWLEARAAAALGSDPLPAALEAESLGRDHVRRIAVGLSEHDLLQYLDVRPKGVDLALAAVVAEPPTRTRPSRILRVWQEIARSRALVFDTLGARRDLLAAADDGGLSRARQALAHLLVSSGDGLDAQSAVRLRAARERVEREERALSLERGTSPAPRPLEFRDVLSRLGERDSLLAYRIFDAGEGPRLAAFLAAGSDKDVTVVDLGAWHLVESELLRWRRAFLEASEEEYRRTAVALRERLWDPVAHRLTTGRCFVVPDGPLFLLPLATLPVGQSYLVERGPTLHYLGAERDLLESAAPRVPVGRVLIAGGPEFGPIEPPETRAGLWRFEPLPGALAEAQLVADAWRRWVPGSQVERLVGPEATEEAWRTRASGATALHLATHGFVAGGESGSSRARSAGGYRGVGGLAERIAGPRPVVQPLAGFALVDANRRGGSAGAAAGTGDRSDDGSRDGIVTLEEIGQLDLRDAQLVVLSFCDSGSGETLDGEGIFGFTRTFRTAGAGSLVLALAPVSDRDSLRFMEHFYSALLGQGQTVDAALRQAAQALLSDLRRANEDTHPRRWGAMVSTGAPAIGTPASR